MACSCDSCSSPRIIKTRTATFWRWLAQSRGETADRVISAPVRAVTRLRPQRSRRPRDADRDPRRVVRRLAGQGRPTGDRRVTGMGPKAAVPGRPVLTRREVHVVRPTPWRRAYRSVHNCATEWGLAPAVGFEPTTKRLTAARSTTELRRNGREPRARRATSRGRSEGYRRAATAGEARVGDA